ncbi:MAG: hypothetical protein K9J74_08985 [Sulfuritalea sp.]|nr:hypothetical protein [Sulfuritalea sp.]
MNCRHPDFLWAALLTATVLTGCASYRGAALTPGIATLPEVVAVMGEPAERWQNGDGSVHLAYPRGPEGTHTFMVHLGSDGHLKRIENVLDEKHFAEIRKGSDQASVVRLIGPPVHNWTSYFAARDELAWEWLYCDGANMQARFNVLFDGTTKRVRSTLSRPDYRGTEAIVPRCGSLPKAD